MNIEHWWNYKDKKTRSDERPPTNPLSHGIASEFGLNQLSSYCTETYISWADILAMQYCIRNASTALYIVHCTMYNVHPFTFCVL